MSFAADKLITGVDVKEFFRDAVVDAIHNQHVEARESTVFYVVNLLCYFARVDRFFEWTPDGFTLRPLALIYRDALEANSQSQRNTALRRLGDVSLFVAGIFTESLNRKVVDVNYYIAMGGNAYSHLSDSLLESARAITDPTVFFELSEKFSEFVSVLNEVGEKSNVGTHKDILCLYEEWMRTNSPRAARRLRMLGIQVSPNTVSQSRH